MEWEPPSVEHLQELLPRYQISGFLGRGGMGAVYRGRQADLDRDVAIKILPESVAEDDSGFQFAERFRQEAQAMARLMHPQIVSVFDFGQTDEGQLFFAMEFVDGVDVQAYIGQHGGRVPARDAVSILTHVLVGLAFAHANGIIHRDIKPANILIDRRSQVKVADFGLAKRFEGDGLSTPTLTMTDATVGTPDFVAPEALQKGVMVDHRADLYAVGVMLYQMLTGVVPRGAWKPASRLVAGMDPRCDAVIAKAMDPDPEGRYQSADEMRHALLELLEAVEREEEVAAEIGELATRVISTGRGKKGAEEEVGEKKLRWVPVVAGALGLVVAVALGFVFWLGEGEEGDGGGTDGDPDVESGSPFPLKVPPVPTRPELECRLVMVQPAHVTEAVEDPLAEKIGELDLSDIVDFDTPDKHGRSALVVLRSDGECKGWQVDVSKPSADKTPIVWSPARTKDCIAVGSEHGILREGGRLYSSDIPEQFLGVPIVKSATCYRIALALTESGRVFAHGNGPSPGSSQAPLPLEAAMADPRRVVDIGAIDRSYVGFTFLYEDGASRHWVWTETGRGSLKDQTGHRLVSLGTRGRLALSADGTIETLYHGWWSSKQISVAIAEWKGQMAEIALFPGKVVVAETKSGEWIVISGIDQGGRRWKEVEEAIQGAVEVTIQQNGLVYALLPKDEVPRSGFWKAEELVKARKEAKRVAEVFPLKPPPVPTRPEVECRMVVVPPDHVTEGGEDSLAEKIEELDLDDIVDFSAPFDHGYPEMTVLLADGELKHWRNMDSRLEELSVPKSRDCIALGTYLDPIRDGGRLYRGNIPEAFMGKPIVKTAGHQGRRFALTADGRVFRHEGHLRDLPRHIAFSEAWEGEKDVVDIAVRPDKNPGYTVLLDDGSIRYWGEGADLKRNSEIESKHSRVVRLDPQGHLLLYADGRVGSVFEHEDKHVAGLFAPWKGQITEIASYHHDHKFVVVARTKAGDWIIVDDIEHGGRRWEETEAAVRGAMKVVAHQSGLVYALLPKDEVPRSGFWKAEDLVKARAGAVEK